MDNHEVLDAVSKIAQCAQHLVTKMLRHERVLPSENQWNRLYELYDLAGEADNKARRERAKAKGGRGVCRFCGCTEDNGCMIEGGGVLGDDAPCSWVDKLKTVCSNPLCVEEWNSEKRQKAKVKS